MARLSLIAGQKQASVAEVIRSHGPTEAAIEMTNGTLDASLVHPRDVFRAAAEHSAAVLVVFHNHPSGDPTPSVDDVQLTRRLVEAGELMGIAVVDHIVLGDACWHSVRESAPGLFRR